MYAIRSYYGLREGDYYRDDPIVLRLLGLRKLPDVATISRALSQMESDGVENVRELLRSLVLEGLQREQLPRLTMDFDGSVQSTNRHAEGTAIGYNKNRKGARSYYPFVITSYSIHYTKLYDGYPGHLRNYLLKQLHAFCV